MKKLKLNLDELKVESFEIKENSLLKGTVEGNVSGAPCSDTLDGAATCDCPSYVNTCIQTCYSCVHATCGDNCTHPQYCCVEP